MKFTGISGHEMELPMMDDLEDINDFSIHEPSIRTGESVSGLDKLMLKIKMLRAALQGTYAGTQFVWMIENVDACEEALNLQTAKIERLNTFLATSDQLISDMQMEINSLKAQIQVMLAIEKQKDARSGVAT